MSCFSGALGALLYVIGIIAIRVTFGDGSAAVALITIAAVERLAYTITGARRGVAGS